MKTFLDDILEIDSQAKETVAQADLYAKQCQQEAAEKKAELERYYEQKRIERLALFKKQEQAHFDDEKKQLDHALEDYLLKINNIFAANHEAWEQQIFRRITGKAE